MDNENKILTLPAPDPEMLAALADIVGQKSVSAKTLDRLAVSRDLGLLEGKVPEAPAAVIWPGSEEEIADVIKWCNLNKVPLTTDAGGAGVGGASIPLRRGIALDLKRLNKPLCLNEINHTVEAEAGIMGETLERFLNRRGYSLGHFPSSFYCSTLGGWLAAGSAGQLSSQYGKIEDMVISLAGVLPDGTRFQSVDSPRSAAGPDLDQLIIGSEGTLAVITRAVLAVHPLPQWSEFRGYLFETLPAGVEAMRLIMRQGLDPCVARLYDPRDARLYEKDLLVPGPGCLLIIGFEGPDNALTRAKAGQGFSLCAQTGQDLGTAPAEAWRLSRYSVSYRHSAVPAPGHTLLETCEVAIAWSKVVNLYEAMRAAIEPFAMVTAHISHVYSTGAALDFTFVSGSQEPPGAEVYDRVWSAAMEVCLRSGGTVSRPRGGGAGMKAERGPAGEIYRRLKKQLDPQGILSPGQMAMGHE